MLKNTYQMLRKMTQKHVQVADEISERKYEIPHIICMGCFLNLKEMWPLNLSFMSTDK